MPERSGIGSENPEFADVAAAFAVVAQDLMSRRDFQHTLEGVVEAAVEMIDGCDFAGVMTVQNGRVESRAVTSGVVRRCDKAQVDAGEGPCLTVLIEQGPPIRVDDLSAEHRWPQLAHIAAMSGVRSVLCCPLDVGGPCVAALNLYSSRVRAFDADAVQLGRIFAMHAAMAMTRAQAEEQLREALDGHAGLGQAMGMLMERHQCSAELAFDMLRVASEAVNLRLGDLAEQVVHTGMDPHLLPPLARGPIETAGPG